MTAVRQPRDRLGALAVTGRAAQWRVSDIDWDIEARPPRWLPRATLVGLLSQIYHGERATVRLCRALRPTFADAAARACLDVQIADEARHAAVFGRYLERLGGPTAMDETLAATLDSAARTDAGPEAAVVAYHVVLEGEALDLQRIVRRWVPCPLLTPIVERVVHDEARHIAFGRLFLSDRLGRLGADERSALYREARALWL
ncbi:MAG: ferritin-like domain-containing protein, partial [Candidatus Eiseniibacteriota bacterium]